MKLKKTSARRSNESNLDGASTNRDEIARGFYSFLFFCRDTLAEKIKDDCVGALRRLGKVKREQN